MQSVITRLALFQFLAVVYAILVSAVFLKLLGLIEPGQAFAAWLRSDGFVLLVLPAVWLLCASWEAHRPKRDTGDSKAIFSSGFVLLIALLIVGFEGTYSAMRPMTHVVHVVGIVKPTPTPAPARFRSVLE